MRVYQVFDIDETVLSNAEEWTGVPMESSQQSHSGKKLLPAHAKENPGDPENPQRPALKPALDLYRYLYWNNYSVRGAKDPLLPLPFRWNE